MKHKINQKKNAGTQDKIISYVKNRILSGEYKPGKVLPPRTFFVEEFGTTLVTVQRAFDSLISNGSVVTKSRLGSFVAARPPILFRYALVFSRSTTHRNWTRFWQLMLDYKSQLEKELDIDIEVYQGLDFGESCPGYHEFIRCCKDKSFAGVIFTSELHNFPKDIYKNIDVPATCISSFEIEKNISRIVLDQSSFYQLCAKKLSDLKVSRVGIIAPDFFMKEKEDLLKQSFELEGLSYNQSYVQGVAVREQFWARRFINLLMEFSEEKRIDALLVLDDNLLLEVIKGVNDCGVTIGKDIEVVSHANLPINNQKASGVNFVGYDVVEVLRKGIENLRSLKEKSTTFIKADFLDG